MDPVQEISQCEEEPGANDYTNATDNEADTLVASTDIINTTDILASPVQSNITDVEGNITESVTTEQTEQTTAVEVKPPTPGLLPYDRFNSRCFNCGRKGHGSTTCPAPKRKFGVCSRCSAQDHMRRNCPWKRSRPKRTKLVSSTPQEEVEPCNTFITSLDICDHIPILQDENGSEEEDGIEDEDGTAMVVVSGIWVKNVAAFPTPVISDPVIGNNENKMTAKAVLICRPNSHPFQERTLALDQPVKVGRSVARAKATANNAIFDCKVLSRHHALLWYENGKFYLQDTNSSNGTFVNNNKLVAEADHHEVSSGDIVQFGVDVLENNRKVTHGCIIATLKLYLPDGKEAKASPSIVENNTHVVPLDELYKLHQIIQEATQREQCLETKLTALQTVVDEARRSAEESWQAYVSEERLLSRVSALETQLQQSGKNLPEDKFQEKIAALQDESAAYQVAAKEALDKLHEERLQALALAAEQERCRISAEQEALLVREQLSQTQRELEEVAQRLTDEQKKANEERSRLEQKQWDLQARLDAEAEKVESLQSKLVDTTSPENESFINYESAIDKRIIYTDSVKTKEGLLAENEVCDVETNKANGVEMEPQNNHINLTVTPGDVEAGDTGFADENTISNENERRVTFNLPSKVEAADEKEDLDSDSVDSKTLKYKYQSAQNELKHRIEMLESILESNKSTLGELEGMYSEEKQSNKIRLKENEELREELAEAQQRLKESCNESLQLRERVGALIKELESMNSANTSVISNSSVSYEEVVSLEEELVMLKERYAQINDEKLKLQHDLSSLKQQYDGLRESSYDKMYFYIAPLILIILYLVISAMIS